jgi:hypothetical protein
LVIGVVLAMIVGFSWLGWTLGSTAEKMASDRAEAAVVSALAPVCAEKFMAQADAATKVEELRKTDSWKLREVIEQGGWATLPGSKEPLSGVANACAEQILKAKK